MVAYVPPGFDEARERKITQEQGDSRWAYVAFHMVHGDACRFHWRSSSPPAPDPFRRRSRMRRDVQSISRDRSLETACRSGSLVRILRMSTGRSPGQVSSGFSRARTSTRAATAMGCPSSCMSGVGEWPGSARSDQGMWRERGGGDPAPRSLPYHDAGANVTSTRRLRRSRTSSEVGTSRSFSPSVSVAMMRAGMPFITR